MRAQSMFVCRTIPLCLALALAATPLLAAGHLLHDQSDVSTSGGFGLTSSLFANDFEVLLPSRADSVTF